MKRLIRQVAVALDLTRSLWIWDAPYCDDSAMMICQLRIIKHGHDSNHVWQGYVCEDFDRDGYCSN